MLLTIVRLWSIGNFSPFSNLCSSCSFPHVWGQTPGLQKEALCWADQFSLPWQPEHALVWRPAPRIWGCGTHDAPSWWFLQRPNVPAPSSWQPRKHAQQWHEQRWENTQLSEPCSLMNPRIYSKRCCVTYLMKDMLKEMPFNVNLSLCKVLDMNPTDLSVCIII